MSGLTVAPLSEARFRAMPTEWDELIARSDADPLFLGWAWQWGWWETWSVPLSLDLLLLAATDEAGKLVGLAPLYRRRRKGKDGLPRVRLEPIGNCRGVATVRTEYTGFICDAGCRGRVIRAFLDHLAADPAWQEWVISDTAAGSALWRELVDGRSLERCYVREVSRDLSYFIRLDGEFTAYLDSLGPNTRLKLYNRRRYAAQLGRVEYRSYAGVDLDRFFDDLNRLHGVRWQAPCFDNRSLAFHRTLAARMAEQGSLCATAVLIDGRTLSVLYDVRVGGTEYNIQIGFDDTFDKKLSPGMMHLGYAIESAYRAGVGHYNLLAGRGMRAPYKARISRGRDELVTIQVVRDFRHKLIYRFSDTVTIPLKKRIKAVRALLPAFKYRVES